MENLSILKLNDFDTFFWKAKVGFNQEFNLLDYSEEALSKVVEESSIVIVDFYFSRTSLDEEQEIRLNIIEELLFAKRDIQLFILSPSYAGETMLKIKRSNLRIKGHNFSSQMMEEIANALRAQLITKKAS